MILYLLMALGPFGVALFSIAAGVPVDLAGALGLGTALLSFLALEVASGGRVSGRTLRHDVVHAVLSAGTAQLCLLAAVGVLAMIDAPGALDGWSWWWQVPLIVIGTDFLGYWGHRLQHRVGALWRAHRVHHTPDELYALNGLRAHPFDTAFAFLVATLWALALGVSHEAFVAAGVLQTSFLLLQHARGAFPRWLEVAFVTPQWHAMHHDIEAVEPTNLAHITTVWDRAFGTFRASRTVEVGVDGERSGRLVDTLMLRGR